MKQILKTLSLLLLFAVQGFSQIKIAPEYTSGQPVVAELTFPDSPEKAEAHLIWSLEGEGGAEQDGLVLRIWPKYGLTTKTIRLRCTGFLTVDGKYVTDSHKEFQATFKAIGVGNDPTPVDPIEPKPIDPKPPNPSDPAPIKEPGFRVLILYESAQISKLNAEQQKVLYSTVAGSCRDYMTKKCIQDTITKVPEWRILDRDVDVSNASRIWNATVTKYKGNEVPWLVVSNGVTGFAGKLPLTEKETLDILKKIGGE